MVLCGIDERRPNWVEEMNRGVLDQRSTIFRGRGGNLLYTWQGKWHRFLASPGTEEWSGSGEGLLRDKLTSLGVPGAKEWNESSGSPRYRGMESIHKKKQKHNITWDHIHIYIFYADTFWQARICKLHYERWLGMTHWIYEHVPIRWIVLRTEFSLEWEER